MRSIALALVVLISIFLTACGARQSWSDDGYPSTYTTITYEPATSTRSTQASGRAVCTPYVYLYANSSFALVRNVCEVDEKLYRAVERAWRGHEPVAGRGHGASGSALEFPGPEDRVAQANEWSGASDDEVQAAARRMFSLLDDPDPVAGVGNPGHAHAYLRQLPARVFLPVLDILDERGRIDEIVAYVKEQGLYDDRLHTMLGLHAIANLEQLVIPDQVIAQLQAVVPWERVDAAHYLANRYTLPRDIELLLEGFLAMESAHIEWRDPMVIKPAGGPPAPIEPGPWEKPAAEPAEMYIGKEAHRIIADHYEAANPDQNLHLNHTPISTIVKDLAGPNEPTKLYKLSEAQRALRPDIVNLTQMHIYEIKPAARFGEGMGRALMYVGVLRKGGVAVSLGPMGAPGTSGYASAPGGVFIFQTVTPGVITYQYRRGRLVAEPVLVEQTSTSWSWKLEPLTDQQRSVLYTAIVIAGAIIFAIVTAPASG